MEIALGILSLAVSGIAFWFALKSDKKMQAIADLNFDEKLAMFAHYLDEARHNVSVQLLERMRNDFFAVSNLHKYASKIKKERLIKDYLIPLIRLLIANEDLSRECMIPLNEIIEKALQYNIDSNNIQNFKEQLRGLN